MAKLTLAKMKKKYPASMVGLAIAIESDGKHLRRKYNNFGNFVEMVVELNKLGYVEKIESGFQDGLEYINGKADSPNYDRNNYRYDSYTDEITKVYLKKNNPIDARLIMFYIVEHWGGKCANGICKSGMVEKYVRPNSKNGRFYQDVIAKAKLTKRK